ncbi:MAG: hypothetical protein J0M21_11485 [Xanthomonadales bacterium]|nr:hypothetical protein [Xanthomonadales bacterium]
MDAKNGPFSLYDFLGYFFPGAIFIFASAFFLEELHLVRNPISWVEISKASEVLPFVLCAYLLGHLLALTSSFTIERYFIWSFDYPSKTLLRLDTRQFLSKKMSFANVIKICVWIFLLPISVIVTFLCFVSVGRPGMVSALDPLLARIIRRKVHGVVVDQGQVDNPDQYGAPNSSDFFRLAYHYALEHAPAHVPKMHNYVALFGFHRAISLTFVLLFWLSVSSLALGKNYLTALQLVLGSGALAALFFFGFAKFYRRYSLEALMALTSIYVVPQHLVGVKHPKSAKKQKVGIDIRDKGIPAVNLMRQVRRRAHSAIGVARRALLRQERRVDK